MMKMKDQSIILKIFQWDGTVSRFLIGSTNCMVLVLSLSARFVEALAIGVEEHLRSISKNGAMLMG
jgi:hypothetical protein